MSVTRILCDKCGFPIAWCECEKPMINGHLVNRAPKQVAHFSEDFLKGCEKDEIVERLEETYEHMKILFESDMFDFAKEKVEYCLAKLHYIKTGNIEGYKE
jgi:hypothetical protein